MFSIKEQAQLCQQYLQGIYATNEQTPSSQGDTKNVSDADGEILSGSIAKLFGVLDLQEQDQFLDLGSGVGKVVLQAFLQTPISHSYGIELAPHLYQESSNALQKVITDLPEFFSAQRQVKFYLGDILQMPLPPATVVLMNSTCFSQPMLYQLVKKLSKVSTIHTVLSLKPFFSDHFKLQRTLRLECSWDSALCYVYYAAAKSAFRARARVRARARLSS